jgi:hypothetical protein
MLAKNRFKGQSIAAKRFDSFGKFFENLYLNTGATVFSLSDLKRMYTDRVIISGKQKRTDSLGELAADLRLKSLTLNSLIAYCLKNSLLTAVEVNIGEKLHVLYYSKHFTAKNDFARILEITKALFPKGYFCHYTALQLHGLTDQMPKTVYVNIEQRMMYDVDYERQNLTQEKIDAALARDVRKGKSIIEVFEYRIKVLHGKDTGNAGVIKMESPGMLIAVTNIERSLIDACVRPELCGGIYEVVNAYKRAKEEGASVRKMVSYLSEIGYVYPYHQSVGFLLRHAGFPDPLLQLLKDRFPMEHDFYLVHGPVNKDKKNLIYSKEWRIFAPKELSGNMQQE